MIRLVAVLLASALAGPAAPEEKAWSWLASAGAPCKGIGVHGAYRVYAEGDVETSGDEMVVARLRVMATSAAFTQAAPQFSMSVAVIDAADRVKDRAVALARPSLPAIEPEPLPTESRRLYAPSNRAFRLARGDRLRFDGVVLVRTSAGTCSLGATRHDLDPRRD